MKPTTLCLIRHAHTNANELGDTPAMAGWADIPLSTQGEAQLEVLRQQFDTRGTELVVYSSDSTRTVRTAEAIAAGRTITPLRSIREISCGIVDGWMISDVKVRFPDLWRVNASESDPHFSWPGGESYIEFRTRVLQALGGIARRHPGGRVVVVTHAGVVSQVIGHIKGTSAAAWSQWRPGNCSVTTIQWHDGPALIDFDDRSHLTLEERRLHGG